MHFEPNPYVFDLLEKNLALNTNLLEHVKIENLGLTNTSGTMEFSFNKANSGGGKLMHSSSGVTVKVDCVDNYTGKFENKIGFIKIDVEGHEPLVIEGARNTIESSRPDLYFEVTENWFQSQNRSIKDILYFLDDLKYIYFYDGPKGLIKLSSSQVIQQSDKVFQFNILAKPDF